METPQLPPTIEIEAKLLALTPSRPGAWLSPLLPRIDQLIRQGVRRHDILDVLHSSGYAVTLSQLEKALYRWRKRQVSQPHPAAPAPASTGRTTAPAPPPTGVHNKGDLANLRNADVPDLDALARMARANLTKASQS